MIRDPGHGMRTARLAAVNFSSETPRAHGAAEQPAGPWWDWRCEQRHF